MTEMPWFDLAHSYGAFLIAYLIGSLSFAVIISKLFRLPDPRTYGSHNPGATNVLRSGSKLAAVFTLLLDGVKGFVPVALALHYSLEWNFEDTTIAFVGVAAFIGHLFPVFFKFQGGKGVATAAGVLLGLEPGLGIATLVIWIVIAGVFRYSSLASILAACFAPFFMLMFYDRPVVAMAVSVMSLLLVWRHWSNIAKLLTGKETRIGEPEPEKKTRRRRKAHKLHQEVRQTKPGALTAANLGHAHAHAHAHAQGQQGTAVPNAPAAPLPPAVAFPAVSFPTVPQVPGGPDTSETKGNT